MQTWFQQKLKSQQRANLMANYYLLLSLLLPSLLIFLKSKLKYLSSKQNYRLPPGPWTLPIIGSIHHLIGRGLPHHALRDLSRQYGGLMFLQLGERQAVVISSREAAKEMLTTLDLNFCTRPVHPTTKLLTFDGKDVALAPYGEYWREMRKVCASELLGAKQIQSFRSIREEEVESLIKQISMVSSSGQFLNLSHFLLIFVNDAILRSIMGSKSKDQHLLLREIKNTGDFTTDFLIANMFPTSRLAHMFTRDVDRAKQYRCRVDHLFEKIISERRKKQGDEDEDNLLNILHRLHDEGSENNLISLDSIKGVILDVVVGGTETTATMLDWAMAELLKNPGIMKKAQTKIRQQLQGREHLTESDLVDLEEIHLILKETIRLHPPFPLHGPRECREACNILGYDIPKGTIVLINQWDMGQNSKYWKDAEKFNPERFAEVKNNVQSDVEEFKFIPFGGGRRRCPGGLFGSAIIEIALANLLYHFDWELTDGMSPDELDMTEVFGITARRKSPLLLRAVPYQC